jgi:purine-binding chemotaxis protein CheW
MQKTKSSRGIKKEQKATGVAEETKSSATRLKSKKQKEIAMSTATSTELSQYLSFRLGDEVFALDILKVREVLDFTSVTKIPKVPDFMRGVINLRGSVVPVIDLRLKFGMPETEKTVNTCVIIVDVEFEGTSIVIGALADSVSEVFDLDSTEIEPSPKMGTQIRTDFLKGMGRHGDGFVMILDIDRVFTADDLREIKEAG